VGGGSRSKRVARPQVGGGPSHRAERSRLPRCVQVLRGWVTWEPRSGQLLRVVRRACSERADDHRLNGLGRSCANSPQAPALDGACPPPLPDEPLEVSVAAHSSNAPSEAELSRRLAAALRGRDELQALAHGVGLVPGRPDQRTAASARRQPRLSPMCPDTSVTHVPGPDQAAPRVFLPPPSCSVARGGTDIRSG